MKKVNLINTKTKPYSQDAIDKVVGGLAEDGIKVSITQSFIDEAFLVKLDDGQVMLEFDLPGRNIVYYNVPSLFSWRRLSGSMKLFIRSSISKVYELDGTVYLTAFNRERYLERAVRKAIA